MTTFTAAWMLAGVISCLIAAASQRHALRNLAFGIIRFELVQVAIAAIVLGTLLIAGPIGLAPIIVYALITFLNK